MRWCDTETRNSEPGTRTTCGNCMLLIEAMSHKSMSMYKLLGKERAVKEINDWAANLFRPCLVDIIFGNYFCVASS